MRRSADDKFWANQDMQNNSKLYSDSLIKMDEFTPICIDVFEYCGMKNKAKDYMFRLIKAILSPGVIKTKNYVNN